MRELKLSHPFVSVEITDPFTKDRIVVTVDLLDAADAVILPITVVDVTDHVPTTDDRTADGLTVTAVVTDTIVTQPVSET